MNASGPIIAYLWRYGVMRARKSTPLPAPPAMAAPVINSATTDTATEETPYTYATTVSAGGNLAGCPIVWSLDSGPAWLTINPVTGVVSGTPPDGSAAAVPFVVRATNCSGTDTETVTVTVSA